MSTFQFISNRFLQTINSVFFFTKPKELNSWRLVILFTLRAQYFSEWQWDSLTHIHGHSFEHIDRGMDNSTRMLLRVSDCGEANYAKITVRPISLLSWCLPPPLCRCVCVSVNVPSSSYSRCWSCSYLIHCTNVSCTIFPVPLGLGSSFKCIAHGIASTSWLFRVYIPLIQTRRQPTTCMWCLRLNM